MIKIDQIFGDKSIKLKQKVTILGNCLIDGELRYDHLLKYADQQKASDKATCIEAIEYATKKNLSIVDTMLLDYVTNALKDNVPRIKWESAKVIGNIARLYPDQLGQTINYLLQNTKDNGTVVRWATVFALAEIIKLKTDQTGQLISKVELLSEQEEDNAVKKKYLDVLKRVKK
ncbi:HEAT repeat domain-containing protein [Sphingobacterium sp.]|uniref:HEAT repeat domain-containing protein n=1 Tax=Sphingobacterium sp. TaxID=341027 RepID=UPI0031DA38F2